MPTSYLNNYLTKMRARRGKMIEMRGGGTGASILNQERFELMERLKDLYIEIYLEEEGINLSREQADDAVRCEIYLTQMANIGNNIIQTPIEIMNDLLVEWSSQEEQPEEEQPEEYSATESETDEETDEETEEQPEEQPEEQTEEQTEEQPEEQPEEQTEEQPDEDD